MEDYVKMLDEYTRVTVLVQEMLAQLGEMRKKLVPILQAAGNDLPPVPTIANSLPVIESPGQAIANARDRRMLEYLHPTSGLTISQLAKSAKRNYNYCLKSLMALEAIGKVRTDGGRRWYLA